VSKKFTFSDMPPIKKSYQKKKKTSPVKSGGKKFRSRNYDPPSKSSVEHKVVDTTSVLTCPIGSAFVSTPANLNAIAQNATSAGRIGAKVRCKNLKLRASILWPGGQNTSSPSQVRFVIVWDKQANGAVASRTDVFQDGTLWYSPMLYTNSERFVVLVDEISDQIDSNGQFAVAYECFRKFDLESVYAGATAVPAQTGALLLFVAANSDINDSTSAHFPAVQFYSRVKYTDL